jgi:hypothetical protein
MLFLYLLLAHFLADFVFQTDGLVAWKQKSWKGIFVHVLVHFVIGLLVFLLFLGSALVWLVLLGISALHFATECYKLNSENSSRDYVKIYLVDQLMHVSVLVLAAAILWSSVRITFSFPVGLSDLGFYTNPVWVLSGIVAIFIAYFWPLLQFQFVRERNPSARMKSDFRRPALCLAIFAVTAVVLSTVMLSMTGNR